MIFGACRIFSNGQPTPHFDPATEAGGDTLSFTQVSARNFYTSGTETIPIRHVASDVSDPAHFRLVSVVVHPHEGAGRTTEPQLRFIFQLTDPKNPSHPFEQLYLQLVYKGDEGFLARFDELVGLREGDADSVFKDQATTDFLADATVNPAASVRFSSSLTGLWTFGMLERAAGGELRAVRIVRAGVDVGYYSSVYDTVLFRAAAARAEGPRRAELEKILDDLTPHFYRDPRRQDVHALNFSRVTCAQCHQMSGRDGVHMSLNDHLDRRVRTPFRATEFLFRELDRQLAEHAR